MVHKVGGEIQAQRKLKRELVVAISTMEDACQDLIKRHQTNRYIFICLHLDFAVYAIVTFYKDLIGLELNEKDLLSVLTRFRTERQVMESFRSAFTVFDDIDNRWKELFDAVTETDPKWNEDNAIELTLAIVKAEVNNIGSFVADMVDSKFSSMYRPNDSHTQLYLLKRTFKDKGEPEADENGDDAPSGSEDVSISQPGQGSGELGISQLDQGSEELSISQPNGGKRLQLVSDNDADTTVAGNWSVSTANGGGGNRVELADVSDLELTAGCAGAEEQQNETPVPPEVVDVVNLILEMKTSSTCHNLCHKDKPPPPRFASLLGLGLKFCPTPTCTTDSDEIEGTIARFRQDFLTKILFTNQRFDPTDKWDPKQLYIRSQEWTPKESDINNEVTTRLHAFTDTIRPWFKKKKASRNLSLTQGRDFLVVPSDKNLRPVIMERGEYVRRCFTDHMLKNTYQQFDDQAAATSYIGNTKSKLSDFLRTHGAVMSKHDKIYLDRYIDTVTDPFSYFYALIKIHKDPWQTRPIVSGSGSILHGLEKWLDRQLQPFIKSLPTYLPSSYKLKDDLDSFRGRSLSRMRLFTGDIVAMYPSIKLDDAFTKIESFLSTHPDCTEELCDTIMTALDLIMRRNGFKFGDTYWLQTDGTAMGVPPAPPFATLYYGIYELELVEEFQSEFFYLKRYIDDQFGIWICDPDPTVDTARWLAFQNRQQSFCSLNWEFSPLSSTVNFLDLSITLRSHSFVTTLYEKPMNLHLYIPWQSAHTPVVQSSFIHSGIHRIFKLVSERSEHIRLLSLFFSRLLARGYPYDFLHDIFRTALQKHSEPPKPPPTISYHYQMTIPERYTRIFIHLPYHQQDPPRRCIQHAFQSKIYQPINRYTDRLYHRILHYDAGKFGFVFDSTTDTWIRVEPSFVQRAHVEPKLDDLRNEQRNHYAVNRLVIAYHRAPNLKNLLFPQHVEARCPTAPPASTILSTLQPAPDAPPL